jgi:hypothetical protein
MGERAVGAASAIGQSLTLPGYLDHPRHAAQRGLLRQTLVVQNRPRQG